MIIVDTALRQREAEGRPIRIGMIGAGFMGRGLALQIATAVPGMRLAAIAARADPATPPVVLILGSLYLAGDVLAQNGDIPV